MLAPTAPVNIPSRDLPQLEEWQWSGSPESPSLATPQTPAILALVGPTPRRITAGFDPAPAPPSRHRRRSSTPFTFELGDAAVHEHPEPQLTPLAQAPDPASTTPLATPAPASGASTPTSPSSSFGAVVRRQIARSKSSLRQLRGDDEEADEPGTSPRQRLKSLITRRSRAQSMTSASSPSPSIVGSVSSSAQLSALASLDADSYDDVGIMPGRRARGKSIVQTARERLQRRRSSFAGLGTPPLSPPFNVAFASAGLQGAAPLPSDELVWGTLSYRAPPAPQPIDHFGTMLPRELKVAVFRTLLDDWASREGNGRWDGLNGGRRELIRISRVSKEWRSLCFDGQLWAHCDFTPFASVLPSATLQTILLNARACVKTLSLHGLGAVKGPVLVDRTELHLPCFSSLASLDLRGCNAVHEAELIDLLTLAPGLKSLNLKGSRVATIYTLDAIRNKIDALEELDVSRCWQLRFLDIDKFIVSLTPPQRQALKTLRVAGLPMASGYLLQHIPDCLPNLECLDLMGCSWIGMRDMQEYVAALRDRPSSLRHLVISNCTGLTPEAIELLVGRVPEMRILEAANLESVFYLDPPPTLSRLVRSMPKLERIDLDGSGRYGGVEDRLLHELIPGACRGSPLEESRLIELRIGNAKFVSKGAIMRLIEGLPNLQVLIADHHLADRLLALV
ncbi:RNI-like protein [Cutaneotrichosporon oleaginosum]|uniref:RNI-like protein n=1 Tax=Cutaneotrichosporon oleaginosum TaxID=879819 RepID=A0A0J0XY49_9TREE|nr:RNI-like protein [Cutaneotrichosporon oleaginosum]KLT45977.1 RNI-like protein [Cutaneotrichosporon oleaginosum]